MSQHAPQRRVIGNNWDSDVDQHFSGAMISVMNSAARADDVVHDSRSQHHTSEH